MRRNLTLFAETVPMLTAAGVLAAQTDCVPSETSVEIYAGAGAANEPGEWGSCVTGTVPRGRKMIWVYYGLYNWVGNASDDFQYSAAVTVNGQTLLSDAGTYSATDMSCETDEFGDVSAGE